MTPREQAVSSLDQLIVTLSRAVDANLDFPPSYVRDLRDVLAQVRELAAADARPRLTLVSTGMRPRGVEKSEKARDEHHAWGI